MKYVLIVLLAVSSLAWTQDQTITMVSYNLLNFPNGRDDCGNNVLLPHRADTLKKIMDYIQPDIFGACEVQNQTGVDDVLNYALNTGGNTNYAAANFVASGYLNVALFYNTDKLVLKSQNIIVSHPRSITHYELYVKDPQLSVYLDTTFIDVYMVHLKAGNSSEDEGKRAGQTQDLMDYLEQQPSNHNAFVCGDMNVYNSNSNSYSNMISGPAALKDPINKPGNWHNNSSFALYHTQATRTSLNYDCGVKGGLDDRFDQILVSQGVMNGAHHVTYQTGSYHAVGNDGNHFNEAIKNGTNSMYPESLVRSLYYMSDHLPVTLKLDVTFPSSGLALVPSVTNVSCYGNNDGTATVTPQLGQPPYTYQWDANANNQATQTATNLSPGSYCVTVTDNAGTTSNYCVTISQPDQMQYSSFLTPDDGSCNGKIQLLVGGGVEPYAYDWADFPGQDTSNMSNLCAGTYDIVITDANGCQVSVTKEVEHQAGVNSEQEKAGKVAVFPNPANHTATVYAMQPIVHISLYSQNGKRIAIPIQKLTKQKRTLNIDGLAKGLYHLKIETRSGSTARKLMVK